MLCFANGFKRFSENELVYKESEVKAAHQELYLYEITIKWSALYPCFDFWLWNLF